MLRSKGWIDLLAVSYGCTLGHCAAAHHGLRQHASLYVSNYVLALQRGVCTHRRRHEDRRESFARAGDKETNNYQDPREGKGERGKGTGDNEEESLELCLPVLIIFIAVLCHLSLSFHCMTSARGLKS